MNEVDLFGQPITDRTLPKPTCEKKKRNETPKGYAGTPGRGPEGHFCRDCRHSIVAGSYKRNFWKCNLRVHEWTHGPGTDIRLKSPACEHWASEVQRESFLISAPHKHHEFVNPKFGK